ncbi:MULTISPECIES: mycofactocin-coupled SDR family oxidoreductase [Streptomyces]|uniref:mycofactocin-coupled SDR family oxidoreductase n=1 Tax=Streptomyces TaxID=1883 RepID=UPI0003A989DB|nr:MULTISPECIES: mycofactocin-coupled SDR family oxidoreductase [Streptomyces]MBZ6114765.1 mycofactocin-coupled SDR family oxidoreductase [Streptomyces olivaceus]MBZ6128710.1 mycofactocin-coupled SDR family oxidoreductase [Streptomyces olivaceus]MBZ6149469.1 mycofactocin-coupled SDR family oxidoreductase [Streptomyces olivaceus]MBZ6163397.1 mycofactocin-coupled SDR family oxidoreductase [Streptomyces olivaceus]MBZ6191202.1 mycofactocin-coupled SDR family oxidoreductase [Streptomyces olivaceus]
MGRVAGKVALVTGAARGMGRSHAVRLAQQGADIIAVDLCADLETTPYPGADGQDLSSTTQLVEQLGRRILARRADTRNSDELQDVVDEAISEFGHIDVVCANAGMSSFGFSWELTDEAWQEIIDVNLTGSWKTVKAVIPHMIERKEGGSLVFISSTAGLIGVPTMAHYTASKHGVVGLMRALAVELAPHNIRVNSVNPGNVDTPMVNNAPMRKIYLPEVSDPTPEDANEVMKEMSALPTGWLDSQGVSDAVVYLASEEARHITGITLPVDAGMMLPNKMR